MAHLQLGKAPDGPVKFKAGEVIFTEGKSSKFLYLVKSGEVILLKNKGNSLVAIDKCTARQILNEVSVLKFQASQFSAIAKTDCELVLVDQNDIFTGMSEAAGWVPEILDTLCNRLNATLKIIDEHNLYLEKNPDLILTKDDEKKYLDAISNFKD